MEPLAIDVRQHNDVVTWMHRVANRTDRPLPLLIVSGAVGAGKSTSVRAAAYAAHVELIELGSDSTDPVGRSKGSNVSALTTRASMQRWQQIVASRSMGPRALFIDDAESLLRTFSSSDGGGAPVGPRVDDVLRLGAQSTPVVIAVTDFYASSLLRELKSKTKGVERVHLPLPAPTAIRRRLAAEFPDADAALLKAVSIACNGDLRRARYDIRYGDTGETLARLAPVSSQGVVRATSSAFDHASAVLGVHGYRLPNSTDAALAVLTPRADMTCRLVRTHYLEAFGDEDAPLDFVADTAALFAHLDVPLTQRSSVFNALDTYATLISTSARLHDVQRSLDGGAFRLSRLSLAGPLDGAGDAEARSAANEARSLVLALQQYTIKTLERSRALIGCTRSRSDATVAKTISVHTTLHRVHAARDVLDTLLALDGGGGGGSVPTSPSEPPSPLTPLRAYDDMLKKELSKQLGTNPWVAPKTIGIAENKGTARGALRGALPPQPPAAALPSTPPKAAQKKRRGVGGAAPPGVQQITHFFQSAAEGGAHRKKPKYDDNFLRSDDDDD